MYREVVGKFVSNKRRATQEELEKKQEIIQKYGLSEDDINYMISYRNSEN